MARARARIAALLLALGVLAGATIGWPLVGATPAYAAEPTPAPAELCSTKQWQADFRACVAKLQAVTDDQVTCRNAPVPSAPDSGLAGWFASRPDSAKLPGPKGLYSDYGYAGYSYTTYDIDTGCATSVLHPDYRFTTMVANGEFMFANAVIGASNALRERAWDPRSMWSWADPLVEQATKAVYQKVFSVFGIITLCVVGLYLLWRSRQSDMSNAMTTAGWAVLVMVAVTALAAWPVKSASIADNTLITSLGVVHDAVGPASKDIPSDKCVLPNPDACVDKRPPAVRASDTATETMLYRNWLRGVLGSADSETAKKYGPALYDARSLSWDEAESIRANPKTRDVVIKGKQQQWARVAEQIKTEDPEAYEYLQGKRDMDRIGAGFIAVLASLLFAMFDLTASLLVLLGFLIFRWAVIAAPILGTVGLMRPASAGLRRLANAVVAAVFNIAIFGTGAAVYLFAVDLIMNTPTLPGWLQVVLVWLCGVVGWLLLRPYRRITQLGGKDSSEAVSSAGSWHRRFFRDMRVAARLDVVEPGGTAEPAVGRRRGVSLDQRSLRPEARHEDPSHVAAIERRRPDGREGSDGAPAPERSDGRRATAPRPRREPAWTEPDVPEEAPSFAVYRPDSADRAQPARPAPRVRSEAR
ncbi:MULTISPECIES: MFS transporter [Micromonospora]|uniref:MFS transporter n=1 Tax=Micromonospora solifontis TaxID=2487138 RepID=A0ABX9WGP5_9ACTN|nr:MULTISPECIES: MFS transporter [Micromonospora]NES14709.1 MFS transporter [Micromonospora sp. PPF5-17B]NES36690.1 MFS transporter [Micromonospora solifontis]NES55717.1 MFS transporter [Micromonospora sp. PPF5-6]RNL99152.1 MFS transporter [Micromonospora solifontis]